jgi:poly(A) polymerase/tRNA nucleotidyltransferase (CCA-adding enzyme)
MKLKIPSAVSRVTAVLEQNGYQAWLVGGSVRDLLLGRTPKDWDVTTNATPEQIVPLFPKTFYENRFGTVTVVNEDEADLSLKHIEITPFRLESAYSDRRHPDTVQFSQNLEDDLKRRDFTINALAYNESQGQLIDLFKGQEDLKDKLIRAVGLPDERFNEDPLRILRAIRLAVELNFALSSDTLESIGKNAELIKTVSAERLREEFVRIIMSSNPMVGLVLCHKLGLLTHFLPELEEGVHMKQNGDHVYDVWEHTLRVLQHAADKGYTLEVRLAALFHDIGKPRTREFSQEKQDYTFYGHEVVGAKMAKKIMERLKFSHETLHTVTTLVRNHMFFSDSDQITLSAVRRIITRVGRENINNLLQVRWCDRIGMGRPKENPYRLRKFQAMIDEALRQPTTVGMLKIDGNLVIRETGIKPGPKIGYILHALLEEVLENPELNTQEQLVTRATELAKLEEAELKQMSDKGKEKVAELEEEALGEIKKKHFVK